MGYIYILTNPSFPDYVKIGYADNVDTRVKTLNAKECTPFAFRKYATYEVNDRLTDKPFHEIIDMLNPSLRSKDEVDGRIRIREFYAMSPEDALRMLRGIAKINGMEDKIKVYDMSKDDIEEEEKAEAIRELNINRHHFKEVDFYSSLTKKNYHGGPNEQGTLCITEIDSGNVVKDRANPSKKSIVRQAVIDLGKDMPESKTLYQCYHELTKLIQNNRSIK